MERATSDWLHAFFCSNLSLGAKDKDIRLKYMFGFPKPSFRDSFKVDVMGNIQRRQNRLGRTMNLYELTEECIMYACDMCIEFYKQSDGLLTPDWITHIAKETCAVFTEGFVEFGTTQHLYCARKIIELMKDIPSTEMKVNRYYNRI